VFFLIVANLCCLLIYPIFVSFLVQSSPLSAAYLILSGTGLTLKLISFHHVMHDNRKLIREINKLGGLHKVEGTFGMPKDMFEVALTYPRNLKFRHFVRFFFAPTCSFQLEFPTTQSIRLTFLAKRLFEILFCNLFIL